MRCRAWGMVGRRMHCAWAPPRAAAPRAREAGAALGASCCDAKSRECHAVCQCAGLVPLMPAFWAAELPPAGLLAGGGGAALQPSQLTR